MFCTECGKELRDDARFCTECGATITQSEPTVVPEQNVPFSEPVAAPEQTSWQEWDQPTYAAPEQKKTGENNGKVSFVEAIKLFFANYVNFEGRASKSEYWWVVLFNMLVNVVVNLIRVPVLSGLVSLALMIPGLALAVRRLHDTGKRWTYLLMGLIPIAGPIILIIQYCQDSMGDNEWGPGPV